MQMSEWIAGDERQETFKEGGKNPTSKSGEGLPALEPRPKNRARMEVLQL